MDDKRIIELLILYCKEELTSGDAEELRGWLQEDKEHGKLFRKYLKKYRRSRQIAFWEQLSEERAWNKIRSRVRFKRVDRKKRILKYSSYAALILLFFSVSVYLYVRQDTNFSGEKIATVLPGSPKAMLKLSDGKLVDLSQDTLLRLTEENGVVIEKDDTLGIRYLIDPEKNDITPLINTIVVPRGGEYFLQLSDGTKIWLNADSKLVYPVAFNKNTREVKLEGEAYFEVAKEVNRPFIVESRGSKVRVLGTCFNISAYEQQESVVTTLVEGSVRISNGRDSLVLRPGEQSVSNATEIKMKEVDVKTYIAWKTGVFEFEEMSLQQITDQLERWYDVKFIYSDLSLGNILFTGAADRHKNMDVILGMIQKLSKVNFIKKDKIITVSKK